MKKNKQKKLVLLIAAFAAIFLFWAFLVKSGSLLVFDKSVQSFFFALRREWLNPLAASLEYLGHWPIPAAVCLIFLGCKKTRFSYGIPMSASVMCSVGMYELLKSIFRRERPDASLWLCNEHGFSFPSGHTLNNTVFWIVFLILLLYYYRNKGKGLPIYRGKNATEIYPRKKSVMTLLCAACIIWPLTISLSRVYVGVHWPSDVCGSWILSVVLISTAALILFKEKKEK